MRIDSAAKPSYGST